MVQSVTLRAQYVVTIRIKEAIMIGLKNIRTQKKLNQQKVAMDLNISREALSHYENGKREPSLDMLQKMSAYFNVSIDYLITGKEFQKK
ncbi:MAG: helix-turn-helix transcriptional regulator [Clostridia bacterium]|nr:helix-turn-helix transcriptional regulator [Clostridia bacterium]